MKQRVALIFGAGGQDGFYLNQLLASNGVKVHGVSRSGSPWIAGNVGDQGLVEKLIAQLQPDFVFHLAANSTTRHSAALENHEAIDAGTLYILEACYQRSKDTKVFLSGSAVQFFNDGTPINEQTPFAPLSAYAASRIGSVYMGRYYRSLGLKVYVGYFFNHDSPLRTSRHVNKSIIETVKRIAAGSDEKLEVGNLSTRKEFNFAGDIVNAVWKLVSQDAHYEAVLGCGQAYRIQDWVEQCFSLVGLPWQDFTQEKTHYKAEYDQLVSDPTLIFSLGWHPQMGMEELAKIMFDA